MNDRRRRAIVCDGDPLMRSIFAKFLAHAANDVVGEAESLAAAVDLAGVAEPDVAIVGIDMPSVIETLPQLLAAAPGCRVVVCTTVPGTRERAKQLGAAVVVDRSELASLPPLLAGWSSPADTPLMPPA